MSQLALPYPGQHHADQARHYARSGNVTMCNIYFHKWACEVQGEGLDAFVSELRRMARFKCLEPDAIGDPALFRA